jgi:glycosyltransferase involved in cell wall biosynthesis
MNNIKYKFYSIIVPSFNRVDEVTELLESMQTLDFPHDAYEIIIVDDGSSDGTLNYLKEFKDRAPFNFSFYRQENSGPGVARNTGMENARGEFFIFIDSDCTVPVHWLTEIDKNLNTHSADAFGGRDSFRHDFPPLLKAINYSMTSFLTTGGLRGKKGKKFAKFYPRSFNMGLSRELWQQIGGFGSLRHGQDIEFSNRILKSGAKVIFIDNAYVYHKRRTNIRRFYRQVYNWGVARINLYKIDPSMLEPLHTFPALVTLGLILVIILAVFFKLFQGILIFLLLVAFLMLIYSMIDALRIYRESKPAFLLPVILPAQVFGYGLGFINNFIRRVLLGKEAKVGFRRNYYK